MEGEYIFVLQSYVNDEMYMKPFDILPMLTSLFNSKLISLSFYLWMRQKFMSGEQSLAILLDLAKVCKWIDLIYALYMSNCADVAERLRQLQIPNRQKSTRGVAYVVAGNQSVSKTVHQFYIRLKVNLDRSAMVNPMEFLNCLVKRFAKQIDTLTSGSEKREQLVNKLMMVHCLQLQLYQKPSDRFSILKTMASVSVLSNAEAAWDAAMKGKLAFTHALDGDISRAEEYRQGVNFVLSTSNLSFITYDIYLSGVNEILATLAHAPSEEAKTRMLFNASTALHFLADEDETIREHWGRMLLPVMCRCLLGVGIDFSKTACKVTQQDRAQAKCRLAQFSQLYDGMGVRRQMMYCYLMAEALSEDNVHGALAYARRAFMLSKEGAHRELERQNIANLINNLERV